MFGSVYSFRILLYKGLVHGRCRKTYCEDFFIIITVPGHNCALGTLDLSRSYEYNYHRYAFSTGCFRTYFLSACSFYAWIKLIHTHTHTVKHSRTCTHQCMHTRTWTHTTYMRTYIHADTQAYRHLSIVHTYIMNTYIFN